MGRRKPFINKRNATTYCLLYGDEDQQPQASDQEQSKDKNPPQTRRDFFPFPPEEVTWDLSENKRKEIVELGLPDDGYDYLQHLKDPAANVSTSENAGAPAVEGPRVFLPAPCLEPPPEDVKYVDARRLPQQTATADVDILQVLGGVAPFAQDLYEQPSSRANDVFALNEIMRELENADDDADDGGSGDLLDDFVSTAAAQVSSSNLCTTRGAGHGALSFIEEEEELSGQSEGSQDTDDDELESRLGRGYVGSIASTYWRPERTDRGGLATLDERFEQLALEYDSDELGELDDIEGGRAGLEVFESLLEKSTGVQASRVPVIHSTHPARGPTHAAKALDRHDDDARIAVEKARELLHANMLDEGTVVPVAHGSCEGMLNTRAWDCESVLTTHTNLDNHPSIIGEPVSSRSCSHRTSAAEETAVPPRGPQSSSSREEEGTGQVEAPAAGGPSMQRRKGETPEEKKQRKEQVKLAKKEARVIKKDTKTMHKISRCRAAANVGPSQRIVPLSS